MSWGLDRKHYLSYHVTYPPYYEPNSPYVSCRYIPIIIVTNWYGRGSNSDGAFIVVPRVWTIYVIDNVDRRRDGRTRVAHTPKMLKYCERSTDHFPNNIHRQTFSQWHAHQAEGESICGVVYMVASKVRVASYNHTSTQAKLISYTMT